MDKKLRDNILLKIKPTIKENDLMQKIVQDFILKLEFSAKNLKIKCNFFIGGSFGKNTYLKGNFDVDIFTRFDLSYTDDILSSLLEQILTDSKIKFKKQNSFDDFIGASEFLIANKYTNSSKLIIEGGSNGGLLVAACITQRPELFAVCICHVPVTDMFRFQNFTEGHTWSSDYGLATDSPEMLDYLLGYSPLHNCKKASYPATLILTADHDDRVVPSHSYKFTASLQTAQQSDKPILIRIDTKSGHGAGKPIKAIIEEKADILNFIYSNIK